MNTPSPLVPQGTSPEPRRRSHLTAVFIILFIHVGVLAGLLLQGCKNETDTTKTSPDGGGFPPTFGTDATPTNPPFPASAVHDLTNNLASTPPPPGVPSGAAPAPYSTPATGTAPPPSYPLPSTPVPAVPSPSAEPVLTSTPSQDHTVMKGETLAIIAKKYNMGWKSIAAANPGLDPTRLKIGQKITIPAKTVSAAPSRIDAGVSGMAENGAEGGTYIVKSGDTLSKIAKNNGTTIKALKALNGLKLDRITVGTKLKIPAKATLQPADPGASAFPASATPVAPVPQNPGTAYASPTLPPPGGRSP